MPGREGRDQQVKQRKSSAGVAGHAGCCTGWMDSRGLIMEDEMTASAMNLSRQKELKVEDSGPAWVGFCRQRQQNPLRG